MKIDLEEPIYRSFDFLERPGVIYGHRVVCAIHDKMKDVVHEAIWLIEERIHDVFLSKRLKH